MGRRLPIQQAAEILPKLDAADMTDTEPGNALPRPIAAKGPLNGDKEEGTDMMLFDLTTDEVERAAERYYDRLFDDYIGQDDAWDSLRHDWTDVCDLIDECRDDHYIAGLVRDYMEGDGDLMWRCYEDGLLAQYINPMLKMKDADEAWNEVCRVFDAHWDEDGFWKPLWEQEYIHKPICEMIHQRIENGYGYDDIREAYNRRHEA